MHKTEKKSQKGLTGLLVVTFIFFILFFAAFMVFGIFASQTSDVDFNDYSSLIQYHLGGVGALFIFDFNDASNIVYKTLSIVLYVLIGLWVLFLILGFALGRKSKKGKIIVAALLMLLAIAVYLLCATGSPKYWLILNRRGLFEDTLILMILTYVLLGVGFLHLFFAIISFIVAIAGASKGAKKVKKAEEEKEETGEAPVAEAGETPVVFEPFAVEPEPEPEPALILEEPKEDEVYVEEEEKKPAKVEEPEKPKEPELTKADIAMLIRDIVREEMARANPQPQSQTNVNYPSGPLVVQYFGTVPYPTQPMQPQPVPPQPVPPQPVEQPRKEEPVVEPKKEEAKKVEPKPEPIPEPEPEPIPEPVVEEEPAPAPVIEEEEPAPAPVEEPAPEEVPAIEEPEPVVEEPAPEPIPEPVVEEEPAPKEKKPIIRIPFQQRMIEADDEMKNNYNELKNEILSYGVNSRVSNSGDAFRLHRKTYVKITIAGLSLKLYFALNPEDYKDSPIPVQDAGHKGIYAEIPLVFKVKSPLSMRRCKELIQTVMEKDGLEQGAIGNTDWVEKLKEEPAEESPEEPDSEA